MSTAPHTTPDPAGLTWDVATLFPRQGQWSDSDFLNLTEDLTRLVELTDGQLKVLEMPTTSHQQIVFRLVCRLSDFVAPLELGIALMAPLRIRLRPGMFREPDVVFALKEHSQLVQEEFWTGADLVMEVVSSGAKSRRRDLDEKRREYATAGIQEYWIVDPLVETISVLALVGSDYQVSGEFRKNDIARSHLLSGFTVAVSEIF